MELRLESEAFRAHNSSLHKNKSQIITSFAGGFAWLTLDQGVPHSGLEHICFGGYHVHCLMFGSVPVLYLLEASNILSPTS